MIQPSWEGVRGWGMVSAAVSHVYRPGNPDEVAASVLDARERALEIGHRGAGLSYGDLAINQAGALIDSSRMNRIVSYDPEAGHLTVEAGCDIHTMWQAVIADGWWIPVVSGTGLVTAGGAVASDIHGKNHHASGSFGEWVTGCSVVDQDGRRHVLRRDEQPAALDELIGSLGLRATITEVSLRLKRVHSGFLDVTVQTGSDIDETLELVGQGAETQEYAVAWVDCFPGGRSAGRSVVHLAEHIPQGHELEGRALALTDQRLPRRIMGVLPSSWAWVLLRGVAHDVGMRGIGAGKFRVGRLKSKRYVETHARFHFLLDYIPEWRRAYQPGGLIQYQLFVPGEAAAPAFREVLRLQRKHGVYSYLGVMKKHRAGRSYAVDGFSLALDFPVRNRTLGPLMRLVSDLEGVRREYGGRLYAAKDAVGRGELPPARRPGYSNNLSRRWASS